MVQTQHNKYPRSILELISQHAPLDTLARYLFKIQQENATVGGIDAATLKELESKGVVLSAEEIKHMLGK